MFKEEKTTDGYYRVVRDDGLVIAEVAGKNQRSPVSDDAGNCYWESFQDPQYVIVSRTISGATLGSIVKHSTDENQHSLLPFVSGRWLFWVGMRFQYILNAKNLDSGEIVSLNLGNLGGHWQFSSNGVYVMAATIYMYGKEYFPMDILAVLFDTAAKQWVTFDSSKTRIFVPPVGAAEPHCVWVRTVDSGLSWESRAFKCVRVKVIPQGTGFRVSFSLAPHPSSSLELWYRDLSIPTGTMMDGVRQERLEFTHDATGQVVEAIPSWL